MSGVLESMGQAAIISFVYTFVWALVLITLPRLGKLGSGCLDILARVPALDVVVSCITWLPWLAGIWMDGLAGLVGVFIGQAAALTAWVILHEQMHRKAVRGPRIVKSLNKIVGRWRNHAALWVSLLALPLFWILRLGEIVIYPLLRWLLGFPKIRHADWISVSRHKFSDLVGHDLIWCLYCDWMTGIYSLGAEMLRVVESFWCPIRFTDATKCEKCRIDFPDIDQWTPADGSMEDVTTLVENMYSGEQRHWFGHSVRLSISAPAQQAESRDNGETSNEGSEP
jgi:hypothetical protein